VIAVYSVNHKEAVNTLRGQNVELLIVSHNAATFTNKRFTVKDKFKPTQQSLLLYLRFLSSFANDDDESVTHTRTDYTAQLNQLAAAQRATNQKWIATRKPTFTVQNTR
jgi:hypothetical protein